MAIDVVPTEAEVLVKVGDGASVETYTHPCLINLDRSMNVSHNYEEDEIPNCDTPANPHDIERKIRSRDFIVSGTGKLDAAGIDEYLDWAMDGTQKNVQMSLGPSTTGRTICSES